MLVSIFLGFLVVTLLLFYRKRKREMNIFTEMGIPGPTPHWLFGNMVLPEHYYLELHMWTKKYGKIYGFYQGPTAIIGTTDLDFLHQITTKQFHNFHGRKELPLQPDPESDIGINMVSAKGNRWKRLRSVINPTFSTTKLKEVSKIVTEKICIMMKKLKQLAADKNDVEMLKIYQRFTMDVMIDAAFGLDDHDGHFLKECSYFFSLIESKPSAVKLPIIFPEIRRYIYWWIYNIGYLMVHLPDQWIHARFRKLVSERRKQNIKRVDMMDLMLNAVSRSHKDLTMTDDSDVTTASGCIDGSINTSVNGIKKNNTLLDEEVVGQCFVFLLAGYETTSNSLGYITYLLATNPDKQNKLLKEIDEAITCEEDVTYENVMKLPYLSMCLNETLRLYPVALSQVNRRCEKATSVNGIHIPEGVLIQADIWSIHHDPDLWGPTDPWKFEPERFSPERKSRFHPMQFLPFGAGPRNCVGMRFGLMEIKLAIVYILKKYSFQICQKTPKSLNLRDALTISTTDGIYVKLVQRN